MSRSSAAAVDTCFLIDWSRYSRRECIRRVFSRLVVTEPILREVVSESVLSMLASWISSGYIVISPIREDDAEVEELVAYAAADPRVPRLDPPDATVLVTARRMKIPLISENKATLRITEYHPRYREVRVIGALEVIAEAWRTGALEVGLREALVEYERETRHLFPRRKLAQLLGGELDRDT